jgi:hypothetical protein
MGCRLEAQKVCGKKNRAVIFIFGVVVDSNTHELCFEVKLLIFLINNQ